MPGWPISLSLFRLRSALQQVGQTAVAAVAITEIGAERRRLRAARGRREPAAGKIGSRHHRPWRLRCWLGWRLDARHGVSEHRFIAHRPLVACRTTLRLGNIDPASVARNDAVEFGKGVDLFDDD